MALLLLTAPVTAKKRHHSKMKNHPITMIDQDTAGVVAYSDTTSLATDSLAFDSLANGNTYSRTVHFTLDDQDISRLMGPLKDLIGIGVLGVFIAIIAIVAIIFLSIMPFVIFGLLIFLIVKHHNDKQRLARAALMSGQPIPQNIVKEPVETDDDEAPGSEAGGSVLPLFFFVVFAITACPAPQMSISHPMPASELAPRQ